MPNENATQDSVSYLEAQRFSGLSRGTLRKLVRNGQLRDMKIGRARRIDRYSLEKYLLDHGYAEQLRLFD
jgi:excisionase family DNA binding protein